jgi:transposase
VAAGASRAERIELVKNSPKGKRETDGSVFVRRDQQVFRRRWGHSRDGKKGKKQVFAGMLCNEVGEAVSVEVFHGNTNDTKTFANQRAKVAGRFGCERATMAGGRGMIKSAQIEKLKERVNIR